ncbi:uncharacterized protein Eint_070140 [Encephalitozoon intestinalis ATCC 50506]|uniref:RRM Nup35-type domain-containing protein n=1 Tax=Encephalitozoon intestinalis (strain ATCC 50506) TaxID=876142 RepID=E0S7U4_ENCIT|nr:uncharacterized protein Eint_070140 [Encephalitozoon intestinalis ATCC 50506]ADM11779.1 hypothetical protein Eint_070140 [Encephalitozoon intestinalis ATCC 50506]UTX45527.1 RRM Nup35-type domain-containing protein [Encephalitozoon intestinalis]
MAEFHPSLFRRKNRPEDISEAVTEVKSTSIPQNTLYEEPLVSQHRAKKKYVTVYGFTAGNLDAVMDTVKSCGEVLEVEYGRNWINVLFDNEDSIKRCLRLNTTMIEDEIVGTFRQGGGIIDSSDIFVRKKGVFTSIMEYLFGD